MLIVLWITDACLLTDASLVFVTLLFPCFVPRFLGRWFGLCEKLPEASSRRP